MTNNLIFYFSGTGNCLKLAKDIGRELSSCELISMGLNESYPLEKTYNSIGFIYPTYFQGMPIKVHEFIKSLDLSKNKNTYIYGVSTYGAMVGNGVSQLKSLLSSKNINLNYGEKLAMVSNYIIMYDPAGKIETGMQSYKEDSPRVINNIVNHKENSVKNPNPILNLYYKTRVVSLATKDKNYNVSDKCTSCGICEKVCPVNNIKVDNKPTFLNKCEQCTACIQFCPTEAINYKNLTQNRQRYTNPDINYKDLTLKSIFIK